MKPLRSLFRDRRHRGGSSRSTEEEPLADPNAGKMMTTLVGGSSQGVVAVPLGPVDSGAGPAGDRGSAGARARAAHAHTAESDLLRASLLSNAGVAMTDQGRLDEAIQVFREALTLLPDDARIYFNLGRALRRQGRTHEAMSSFFRSIELDPNKADAYDGLANTLVDRGMWTAAVAAYRHSITLDPTVSRVHSNLGSALGKLGRHDEALVHLEEALRLDLTNAAAHYNLGTDRLAVGDFERGWAEYEWRLKCPDLAGFAYTGPEPLWDGAPLAGRSILLHAEQGLGDTLQFVRYAGLVKRLGGRVDLLCPAPLARLLARCPGVDHVFPVGATLPACDVRAPLMSLPAMLGTTLTTVPADVPYITAELDLIERWRRDLASIDGYKVGIHWEANPNFKENLPRSIPLEYFGALADVPGVRLISLQKGRGAEQILEFARRHPVVDLGPRLDVGLDAFVDTAPVMMNLDLVVTNDTSIAHLAGALGVPVWVALGQPAEWRWMEGRDDSPWYPTMRLFRQVVPGDWSDVFGRMGRMLAQKISQRGRAKPVSVPASVGELVDRLTILEIKAARMTDPAMLKNVHSQLAALREAYREAVEFPRLIDDLAAELRAVNSRLWDIEDAIRVCEREKDFGPRFIELARLVYRKNDVRATLKRQIDERLGSPWTEQKSYCHASSTECAAEGAEE
jgi:Flp pilus assembly protein TadD